MEAYTAAEPLPLADLFIERAQAVVDVWQHPENPEARQRLERIKETVQEAGMMLAWPEPDNALSPN
jgi:hypothetical protein